MYTDDDEKENQVSPAAANTLRMSELMEPANSAMLSDAAPVTADLDDLEALFRDHHKEVFRAAYRITGSQSDAEDVLQTIFMRLTKGWAGRVLSPNPRAFLY